MMSCEVVSAITEYCSKNTKKKMAKWMKGLKEMGIELVGPKYIKERDDGGSCVMCMIEA